MRALPPRDRVHPISTKSLLSLIQRVEGDLPDSLARVAKYVAADPSVLITMSLAELAAANNVSKPSIVRFCQALGFGGLRSIKQALIAGQLQTSAPTSATTSAPTSALASAHTGASVAETAAGPTAEPSAGPSAEPTATPTAAYTVAHTAAHTATPSAMPISTTSTPPTALAATITPSTSPSTTPFFSQLMESLIETIECQKADLLQAAAQKIIAASQVAWFGLGDSGFLAFSGHHRSQICGINSVASYMDEELAIIAKRLGPGDVLICISRSGRHVKVNEVIRSIKENGVNTVAITGNPGSMLARLVDYPLISSPIDLYIDRQRVTMQSAQMLVLDTLLGTVMQLILQKPTTSDSAEINR